MSRMAEHHLRDDYGLPPSVHGSATSYAAAKAVAPHVGSLKQRVLEYFKAHPQGATDEQLIDAIGGSASTIRPRRIELVEEGLLHDSGRYSLTRSKRRATVWCLRKREHQFSTLMPPV